MAENGSDTVANGSKKTSRSAAWEYFDIIEDNGPKKKVKCRCGTILCYSNVNGTSSMNRHLSSCATRALEVPHDSRAGSEQSIILVSQNGISSENSYHYNENVSNTALEELFLAEELPFAFADSFWFKRFIQSLNKEFNLPSSKTVADRIAKRVDLISIDVKYIISNVKNGRFSYTTDIWTSNQNVGYICLTIHFVDGSFQLQNFVIGFEILPCPHSGVNIGDAIYNICIKYGCFSRSICLVADNASNNNTAIQQLNNKTLENVNFLFYALLVRNLYVNLFP